MTYYKLIKDRNHKYVMTRKAHEVRTHLEHLSAVYVLYIADRITLKISSNKILTPHRCTSKTTATRTLCRESCTLNPYHEFHLAILKTRATLRPVIQHCHFLLRFVVSDQNPRSYRVIVSGFRFGYFHFPSRSVVPPTFNKFPSVRVSVEQAACF